MERIDNNNTNPKGNKWFYIGFLLVAIGALLFFNKLGLIPWNVADILISWQMLLVAVGTFVYLSGNRTGGIIMIVIGGFFMIPEMIHVPREIRRYYWPLILVAIGVAILFRHRDSKSSLKSGPDDTVLDYFDDFVIFGGREILVNSQNLRGGRATSIFGAIEYDFRRAKISPQGAFMDSICLFGGCGIKVPADWNVKNEVTTVFGAFSDKRGETFQQTSYNPSKTIVIKGITVFGGVEIKHL